LPDSFTSKPPATQPADFRADPDDIIVMLGASRTC
jgi:hypothetical protein